MTFRGSRSSAERTAAPLTDPSYAGDGSLGDNSCRSWPRMLTWLEPEDAAETITHLPPHG